MQFRLSARIELSLLPSPATVFLTKIWHAEIEHAGENISCLIVTFQASVKVQRGGE